MSPDEIFIQKSQRVPKRFRGPANRKQNKFDWLQDRNTKRIKPKDKKS